MVVAPPSGRRADTPGRRRPGWVLGALRDPVDRAAGCYLAPRVRLHGRPFL